MKPAYNRVMANASDPFDLARFVDAQQLHFLVAIRELRAARKASHWMWFIFPQVAGLGQTWTSQRYGVRSLDEARAYLAHELLGQRLRECTDAVLAAPAGASATGIFGGIDAMKFRSSMTLFLRAAPDELRWQQALDRYSAGVPDARTDELLGLG
jgi:uncharacterized protein (DUF1810 family)